VSKLVARYRAEGAAALEPRSRRPKTSPGAVPARTVELIAGLRKDLEGLGLDAGPDTIRWHLQHRHGRRVCAATVARYLVRRGLATPQPAKRPKASYIRFAAEVPNECWQADFTHYQLGDGADVEVLCFLDDHSRYAISVTAHQPVTGPTVVKVFRQAVERNHPMTCGKVERFQQTLKRWLRAQPHRPADLPGLHAQLDRFADHYNHQRPTGRSRNRQPRRRPTGHAPKPPPPAVTPTLTGASATTTSTLQAKSLSATTAASITSASDEPTREPPSCSSPPTSTCASSTPPPANSSATSPSTPPTTTNPNQNHTRPEPHAWVQDVSDLLRDHSGAGDGNRTRIASLVVAARSGLRTSGSTTQGEPRVSGRT
jgi:transposase InsO family protein